MTYHICAIRDMKAELYRWERSYENLADAIRSFELAVKSNDSALHEYPDDYRLVKIAEYDSEQGKYKNVEHSVLMDGASIARKEVNNEVKHGA